MPRWFLCPVHYGILTSTESLRYNLKLSPTSYSIRGCPNTNTNRLFLRACFPTARSPTARYFGLCLGGVTLNFKLSGQFLLAVPKMCAVGRKNDTDRTKKSIFACMLKRRAKAETVSLRNYLRNSPTL